MEKKGSLKLYKMVKEKSGPERYVSSWEGQMAVRLRFQLWSSSAGLFASKKRCGMVKEDRCVQCDGGEVEDVNISY